MKMLQAKQNKTTVTAAAWGYGVDQLKDCPKELTGSAGDQVISFSGR